MRKMKLELEKLAVESFEVATADTAARGTVRGNAVSVRFCSAASGCAGDTCQLSCTGSCATGLNCHQVC